MVVSWLKKMWKVVGRRLVIKAYITVVCTEFGYERFLSGLMRVAKIGRVREARVVIIIGAHMIVTFIWSCTSVSGS